METEVASIQISANINKKEGLETNKRGKQINK